MRSVAPTVGALGDIDISSCEACGGFVKIIASIEDPHVIKQILFHLEQKVVTQNSGSLPESQAPPRIPAGLTIAQIHTASPGFLSDESSESRLDLVAGNGQNE